MLGLPKPLEQHIPAESKDDKLTVKTVTWQASDDGGDVANEI